MKRLSLLLAFALASGCSHWRPLVWLPELPKYPNTYDRLESSLVQSCIVAPFNTGDAKAGCVASQYYLAGINFIQMGDLGAASRAFWASALATNQLAGSRWMREEHLAKVFTQLADIAKQRTQPRWEHALRLCAQLALIYVNGYEGKHEHSQYEAAMRRVAAAEAEAAEAASNARFMNSLSGLSMQAGAQMGALSLNQALSGMGSLIQSNRNIDRALEAQLEQTGSKRQQIIEIADQNFLDTEFQSRFLAERTTFYLQATNDARPYVALLADLSRVFGWTGVSEVVAPLTDRSSLSGTELGQLAAALKVVETEAIKKDRNWAAYEPPKPGAADRAAQNTEAMVVRYARMEEVGKRIKAEGRCKTDSDCRTLAGCELGGAVECFSYGIDLFYTQKKPELGIPYLKKACDGGYAPACSHVTTATDATKSKKLQTEGKCQNDYECGLYEKCGAGDSKACESHYATLFIRKAKGLRATLESACAENRPSACTWLARELEAGNDGPKDPDRALEFHNRACEENVAAGCAAVSWYWQARQRATRDYVKARAAIDKACSLEKAYCPQSDEYKQWDVFAERRRGVTLRPAPANCDATCDYERRCEGGDAASCIEHIEAVFTANPDKESAQAILASMREHHCELGLAPACIGLAWQVMSGDKKNGRIREALPWFEKACALGYQAGCEQRKTQEERLASMARVEKGDCANEGHCMGLIKCEAGDAQSCSNFPYGFPEGDPRRISVPEKWCNEGKAYGCLAAGQMASMASPKKYDPDIIWRYQVRACDHNDVKSCHAAAKTAHWGGGVAKNLSEARRLYELACRGNIEEACLTLRETDWSTGFSKAH